MSVWNAARKLNADDAWERPNPDQIPPRGIPEQAMPERVSWAELGCPRQIGNYRLGRDIVRVKKIHLIVADNEPHALFTIVTFRPPLGPPEHMLGHRVA